MHGSKSEFGALGLVLAISPSSDLEIVHHFFSWTPYSLGNLLSKFHNFSQPVGIRFNRFIELASPNRSWAILWVHFGPWFGFLAAHHESIWILVSLHGELVRRVIGECGFEVEGLFSRAECMGK
ncbi:hypothetical protein AAG906_015588 [Vitis piasezkii]